MDDSSATAPGLGLGASSAWVLGGTLIAGLTSTGVILILAGLLTPTEFGQVTVAVLIFEGACMGLSPGLAQAYHALGGTRRLARAALSLALLTGAIVLVFGAPLAPIITRALGVPDAAVLTAVALLAVPGRRWNEVRVAQFERALNFSRPNIIIGLCAVASGSIAVAAAVFGAGAWALLLHLIVYELSLAAVLAVFGPRPALPSLDREEMRQILAYSRKLVGDSLAVYGYTNLDDAVVARLAGPALLGAYNFAYRIANLAALATARPAQRVLLPVLSSSGIRGEEPRRLFLSSLAWLSLLSALACSGVAFLGPTALHLVYGGRWEASYVPLQIFAIYAAFRAIGALTGTVFLAAQRPGFVMRIATLQLAGLAVVIVPATLAFGHVGAAASVTVPVVVGVTFALTRAAMELGVPPLQALRTVGLRWLIAGCFGLLAAWAAQVLDGWLGLGIGVLVLAATATTAVFFGPVKLRQSA